jgi:4-hydroxy-3-polyprenylbenzoate decarboxylase
MIKQSNFAGNIAYDDLREWLAMAERLGEVRTVKGANCEEDIGLAAEAVLRAEHGPCVVFEDIPECRKGFRLLLNMFAGTRRNMTLGFPDHLTKWELSDAYREAYLKEQRIVPHVMVDDGPVLENIMMGDDVDVTLFPAPKWHEKDGGRYIGTGTYSITRDPEENWLNAGAYRAQVHDQKTVGIVMAAGHHGRIHRDKSFKRGEPLPVVMVLGGDPLAFFFGGLEAPYGVFELDLVGGLRGRPVEMVRGKVTGLPFPANAEIVLEGYVPPDRTHPEGPFGEWTGHYAGGVRPIPVLEIKAIYYRNDPIVLGVPPMGAGPDEIPGTRCKPPMSPLNAAHRPMRRNTSSWWTMMWTSPISTICCGPCSREPTPRSRSSSSPAHGIRAPIRRFRRSGARPAT